MVLPILLEQSEWAVHLIAGGERMFTMDRSLPGEKIEFSV